MHFAILLNGPSHTAVNVMLARTASANGTVSHAILMCPDDHLERTPSEKPHRDQH